MTNLKLARLPDRTPVRVAIALPPELHRDLATYAELYRTIYGEAEAVADLIPYMLASFLDSDRGFTKARRDGGLDCSPADGTANATRRNGRGGVEAASAREASES